jgi:NADPH:quinone reductase-like Zn-dependent oxidoreductase
MIDSAPPIRKVLTELATMIDAGQIKPHVSTILPLQEIRKAHEMIEGRHMKGKLVLHVVD